MEEIWKSLEDEGLKNYEISNFGRVRRVPYIKEAFITRGNQKIHMKSQMKEKIIAPSFTTRNPSLRVVNEEGKRINKSLGLLVLKYFSPPIENQENFVCNFKDGDITNLHIDNLEYVSKRDVGSIYGEIGNKGMSKESMVKYKNLLFKFNDIPLAFFHNTTEAINTLNEEGFNTDFPALIRHLEGQTPKYFYIFDVEEIEEEKVSEILNNIYPTNLKVLYDCIMKDRYNSNRFTSEKTRVISKKPKEKPKVKKEEKKPESIKPTINKLDFMSKLQAAMDMANEKDD